MIGVLPLNVATIKPDQQVFGSVFIVAILILGFYIAYRAKKGKVPYVRRIPALEGIDSNIDKCAELGKPVYFEMSGMTRGEVGLVTAAALGILTYVARRCARTGTRLIVGYMYTEASSSITHNIEAAYKAEGKEGFFKSGDLQYLTADGFVAPCNTLNTIETEDCRLVVATSGGTGICPIAEANKQNGCVAIQGAVSGANFWPLLLVSDYSLVGEELYGAGAMISRDVDTLATLRSQDIAKLIIVVLIPAALIAIKLGVLK